MHGQPQMDTESRRAKTDPALFCFVSIRSLFEDSVLRVAADVRRRNPASRFWPKSAS